MSIEALGGNSQDDEHVWLKNPLIQKNGVKINAHTPLDEPQDDKAVTQKDFIGKYRGVKAALYKTDEDDYSLGIRNVSDKDDEAVKFESSAEMIEKSKVGSLQASNLSAKDLVGGKIKRGHSVEEAYTVYKAQKAYETSAGKTKTPIDALGNRKFRAHN